jgi:hypothetical protein
MKAYYTRLLSEVIAAGDSVDLAYQARTRLRRALLALERGKHGDSSVAPAAASEDVARIARQLETRVLRLCQPSEALDARWRREWATVSEEVRTLQRLITEL